MESIFIDPDLKPSLKEAKSALGNTFRLWEELIAFTKEQYPPVVEEWKFAGKKFGWSLRLSDKKRVLVYLLPRDKFFKVALVFGQRAAEKVLSSPVDEAFKLELQNAKAYAEGRGVRIDVKDISTLKDIKLLIAIKIENR